MILPGLGEVCDEALKGRVIDLANELVGQQVVGAMHSCNLGSSHHGIFGAESRDRKRIRAAQGTMRRPRSPWRSSGWPHFELERENARR